MHPGMDPRRRVAILPRSMHEAPLSSAAPPRPSVRIGADDLSPERALESEWLETDGRGGFASGTVGLVPTRRYHGLLVAAPPGTARRHVFLAHLVESVRGESAALDSGALAAFELAPWPRWTWRVPGGAVVRELAFDRGAPTVLVRYSLAEGAAPLELCVRLRFACREADALTIENDVLDPEVRRSGDALEFRPYASLPPVSWRVDAPAGWRREPGWTRGLELAADRARGYGGREDQFTPGAVTVRLAAGRPVVLAASIVAPPADPGAAWRRQAARRAARPGGARGLQARLAAAADDFLYRAESGRRGVIAGYPWFGEWGRDTFLALPGLTLATGRPELCGQVLLGALPFLRDGLLPNVFGATPEESHYGSADAALWFARAVREYELAGAGRERVRADYLEALRAIAEATLAGTALGVGVDDAGLFRAGDPSLNPTWMDAVTSAGPVTPRHGSPVELAALWVSLLRQLVELEDGATRRSRWRLESERASTAFLERFCLPDGALADVWREGEVDRSVRPNMVLAASLELAPLSRAQRRAVVERARAELVTPYGLRTLAPGSEGYRGTYGGGPEERDGAYHQGTVWPWLVGAYVEASLRGGRSAAELEEELAPAFGALERELDGLGLNHVSEVFSGDPPHGAGGTIAQAWNTAELLRASALLEGARAGSGRRAAAREDRLEP